MGPSNFDRWSLFCENLVQLLLTVVFWSPVALAFHVHKISEYIYIYIFSIQVCFVDQQKVDPLIFLTPYTLKHHNG